MIVLIDYGAGNTRSVINALKRMDIDHMLTDDHETIKNADKVIFPGVGHAGAAMEALKIRGLIEVIKTLKCPVLGICVGMQLLCTKSEEGNTVCLGIIPETVKKFNVTKGLKIPHMGWNRLHSNRDDALFNNLGQDDYFYFVHSYYVPLSDRTTAMCHYGLDFSAIVQRDNFYGIQFHAEKSGNPGGTLLKNFLSLAI